MSAKQPIEVLNRLRSANQQNTAGNGLQTSDFVPLAQFYSRRVGRILLNELFENQVRYRVKYRRVKMSIEVMFADRKSAYALLEQFNANHHDVKPTGKRRDYDLLFLCGLLAVIPTIALWIGPAPNWTAPAYFASATFVGFVAERLYRNFRYYGKLHLGALDCLGLTLLAAIGLAIWKLFV